MNDNIYLTGGSGFIGRNLISYLNSQNIQNLAYSRSINQFTKKIDDYKNMQCDSNGTLIHLAQNSYLKNHKFNEDIETCNYISSQKWKHIIYISSALVYGDKTTIINSPNHSLSNIKYDDRYKAYVKTKIESEKIFLDAGATIFRLANVYGPFIKKDTIFDRIVSKIKNDEVIELQNTRVERDFIWIEDVIKCIFKATEKKNNNIFNLGSGSTISINELTKKIQLILNTNKKINSKNLDFSCIKLDVDETKKTFNWKPLVDINHGLKIILKN